MPAVATEIFPAAGWWQPWSLKRKLSSWAEAGGGATLPGLCVGTQGWQSTPRYCFALLHEIKSCREKCNTWLEASV